MTNTERNRKKKDRKKKIKQMRKDGTFVRKKRNIGTMPGFENFKIYGSKLKEVLVPMGGKVA